MGRTLDSLKHAEATRAIKAPSAAETAAPADCIVDWTLQEEVPYVEVGAPGKGVEMSPLLVKHPPQPKMPPPLGRAFASPKAAPVVNLTDAKPMTVAFEAWPRATTGGVAPEIIAHHQPTHPVTQEYAGLLDKLLAGQAGPQTLLLSGLTPHVGASTVLLNLAVLAARQDRRVAVLDLNLAHPGLATRLGQTEAAGLREILGGSLAVGQALRPTAVANLHLLPAGAAGNCPDFTADAIGWLLAWVRERHDLVLIDGPCVVETAELAVPAPCADAIYLVLPQSESSAAPRGIAATIARLGGRLRGLIHTHFEL